MFYRRLSVVILALASNLAFAQSPAVQLTISAPKPSFYLGEVIPLELKLTALDPNRFRASTSQQDRIGRLNYLEQYIVEPSEGAEDPLAGTPAADGGMGGISGGPTILSDKPYVIDRVLNDWIRFRHPGEFRIHVISRRVDEVDDPKQLDGTGLHTAHGKQLELVSNTLTLSITAAPADWIAQQIAESHAVLAQSSTDWSPERRKAIAVLRALGTADAAMELARSTDDDVLGAASLAILASPHRKELLPLLEQRLVAADQGITDRYIGTLAELAQMVASGGPMPPYPKNREAQLQWQAESKRRFDLRQRKHDEYVARLVAALPAKRADARLLSLHGLLTLSMHTGSAAPWLGQVASALAAEIRHLPPRMQTELLEAYWGAIKSPTLLPVLREFLDSPQLGNLALRRIYELAPDEGRKIILDEIRHPSKPLDFPTLAMLPDATLPDLNEALAARMDSLLILRYASGDIVKQVEKSHFARATDPQFCAGPLAFYFLKYDPPLGEKLLLADFAKPGLPPACYDVGFQFLSFGRWAYSPALEKLAIASLTSDKVPIKRGAAELLGKYGSTAARKPLWDTMEYFRSWWKDREKQLDEKTGDESRQLELALRTALANAAGWVLTDAELRRLLDLCSSEWCRNDVKGWIASSTSPVNIQAYGPSWSPHFMLGSYGTGDADWLTRKLSQFPPSVTFRINSPTPDLRDRAEQAIRTAGRITVQ